MNVALRLMVCLLFAVLLPAQAEDKLKDDSAETLAAVMRVKARILPNARSADTLGTLREGNGVLIREADQVSEHLAKFRDGDQDAFEALFRLHQRAVYGWILRIVRNPPRSPAPCALRRRSPRCLRIRSRGSRW